MEQPVPIFPRVGQGAEVGQKEDRKILMTVHKVNQISCQDCACANLYHKLSSFIIFGFFTSFVSLDSTVKA